MNRKMGRPNCRRGYSITLKDALCAPTKPATRSMSMSTKSVSAEHPSCKLMSVERSTSFLSDRLHLKSPVYHSRLCGAASTIQAFVRGAIQLRRYCLVQIEKTELAIQAMFHGKATKMQSLVRGRFGRMHARVLVLERKLATSESIQNQELEKIQQDKTTKMKQLRRHYKNKYSTSKDQHAHVKKSAELIRLLRDENKLLRRKTGTMRKAGAVTAQDNRELEIETMTHNNGAVSLEHKIAAFERENLEWETVLELFKDRSEHFEELLHERKDRIRSEKKISQKVRGSIQATVDLMGKNREDEDLYMQVMEIRVEAEDLKL